MDHGSGRLVWAAPGRDTATLSAFFDALGEDRCALITHVSAVTRRSSRSMIEGVQFDVVRHEALIVRMEVEDLRLLAVVAVG